LVSEGARGTTEGFEEMAWSQLASVAEKRKFFAGHKNASLLPPSNEERAVEVF